jgi:hypothetical protein
MVKMKKKVQKKLINKSITHTSPMHHHVDAKTAITLFVTLVVIFVLGFIVAGTTSFDLRSMAAKRSDPKAQQNCISGGCTWNYSSATCSCKKEPKTPVDSKNPPNANNPPRQTIGGGNVPANYNSGGQGVAGAGGANSGTTTYNSGGQGVAGAGGVKKPYYSPAEPKDKGSYEPPAQGQAKLGR